MGNCASCKYWVRGTITVFAPDATYWHGGPHEDAGKTKIDRPLWNCHLKEQDIGECGMAVRNQEKGQLIVATCSSEGIYGELVTDAKFSCCLFEQASPDWDHYDRDEFP